VSGIGITNQRETVVVWNKHTGKAIYNAISWQDKRSAAICNMLRKSNDAQYIHDTTGLVVDAYFSGTKIQWILDNVEAAREQAERGELLAGTIDTWLIWKLTQGALHITDSSNASRTMLLNLHTGQWDAKLLEILDIPVQILPRVCNSSEIYGSTKLLLGIEIPIAGIAGDQQAALFGQCCHEVGMAKNTYGTGCFLLMNTGEIPVYSNNGLLTTIAWSINGQLTYALEGSVFISGAAIKWLRDQLHLLHSAAESEQISQSVGSTNGVYFVPAFTGLGAPYWDPFSRAAIFGLTQASDYRHIVRAAVEASAYQTKDILVAMAQDAQTPLKTLRVDGGASTNNFLLQFQADLLHTEVDRPLVTETTALGAAMLAALALGFWTHDDLDNVRLCERKFIPAMTEDVSTNLYKGWQKAVHRTRDWNEE
jgi:glycerol kinase